MLLSKQIIDRLDRIESGERHFHEDRVPIAHSTIPQTGKFKCLKVFSVLALAADKASRLVNIIGQIESVALVVFYCTDQVDRIEMGSLGKHFLVGLIALVNLAAFENLQTHRTVLIVGKEGAAARLADILHHTAHTHRSVELGTEILSQLIVSVAGNLIIKTAEIVLQEIGHLHQLLMAAVAFFKFLQIPSHSFSE